MFSVDGRIVLITGAARGMGRLYALRAAAEGAKAVVLWDVDESLLAEVAAELGPVAHPYRVDLSDPDDVVAVAQRVRAEVGDPDVVVNNAGIVRGKPFVEHDQHADIALTMAINALAPMHVTREFLPAMLAAGEGRVLNIASAAALVSNPGMSIYGASKWAVLGWSDSLRLELEGSGIRVTTVCPSFVDTGMFAGARAPRLTRTLVPEKVVDRAWRAMLKGTPILMLPGMVGVGKVLKGVLPTGAWDVVGGKLFRVHSTMNAFTGRPGA
jgi:NAD(P)-dependent dehydrogenase (short-subunit alcohol dehydrogenase family)